VHSWSRAHPTHLPIVIQVEAKDGPIADPLHLGFVQPLPIDADAFRALEGEIRSVFRTDELLRPVDVRGDHATLRDAVTAGDWPRVDDVRGRVMFVLDDHAAKRTIYRTLHPDLDQRLLFVDADPGEDDAAYMIRNDPVGQAAEIATLLRQGFLVRTRADADTVEARRGDHSRADAAIASGAQVVTTDYERPDPRYPSYVVHLPGRVTARCRPHDRASCEASSLADPRP
jgi:calcium-dependent phosphoinositide phospholipase C